MTFFPLSYISHLQFDFLDLSSSSLLLLNDDKIYRRETALFFIYISLQRYSQWERNHFKNRRQKDYVILISKKKKKWINKEQKKKKDGLITRLLEWSIRNREIERRKHCFFCIDLHIYTHISGYLNFKLAFTITSVVIVI